MERLLSLLFEYITDSTNGLDEFGFEGVIDLLPEPPDGHFYRVGVAFKVYIPDLFGNKIFGEDLPAPTRQQRQQKELTRCKVDLLPSPQNLAPGNIDLQVRDA